METMVPIIGTRGVSPAGRDGVVFELTNNLHNMWGYILQIYEGSKLVTDQSGRCVWGEYTPTEPPNSVSFWADDFRILRLFPLNPPSRAEVLSVNIHYLGGLIVNSPVRGRIPWWDSGLAWESYETRKEAYKVKHENGDSHVIFHIPSGVPLYPDPSPRNFYNPRAYPALDWTNGLTRLDTRFDELLDEIIQNRFKFIINMDERMEKSLQIIRLVMERITSHAVKFGFSMPGYDGVYAQNNQWPDASVNVARWAAIARSIQPSCYLGMMHGPHYIPFGNTGPEGYLPGGAMDGFDWVAGEFPICDPRPVYNPGTPLDVNADSIWQVGGRMLRDYRRPPEQPVFDDPNPPFYLVDSVRGKRYYCFLETMDAPYEWVRTDPYDDVAVNNFRIHANKQRAYARELGFTFTG